MKPIARLSAALLLAAAPVAAPAQLFFSELPIERTPVELTDPIVESRLPGATPEEARAGMVWMLRSALNVAALQCGFSRYLRTVDNYNAVIAHHSGELAIAYTALDGYFRRLNTDARAGQRQFDTWSTNLYQDFSTISGTVGFCQTTGNVGKDALALPKGEFFELSRNRLREIRASLRPMRDRLTPSGPVALTPIPTAPFVAPDCTGLRGRELEACQAL